MRFLLKHILKRFIRVPQTTTELVPRILLSACQPRQAAAVARLIATVEQRELGIAYSEKSLQSIARGIRRYARHTDANRFYLLHDAESKQLIGCGGFFKSSDNTHTAVLFNIYLLPPYQGQGLGKALITHLKEEARALGYLRVMLEARNPRAIGLYSQLGFETIGEHQWTAPDGQVFASQTMGKSLYPARVAP